MSSRLTFALASSVSLISRPLQAAPVGTEESIRVQTIPYGEVQLYGEVAAGIGNPSATRAVARACAANTVALMIPCHKVIRGTGELAAVDGGSPGSGR